MKRLVVALILCLTSCSTPSKQEVTKALSRVSTELTAIRATASEIQEAHPESKPKVKLIKDSVSNIESELPVIDKEVDKFVKAVQEEEPSVYEEYIPWALMLGGIATLWFAIKTPDPFDDIVGGIMCASSFIVAKYFDEIAIWSAVLLVLYLIIIGAKYFALKKVDINKRE